MSTLSLVVSAKDRSSQTIAAVESKIDSLNEKVSSVSDRMKSLGDGMQSVGTKMSAGISLPILGIGMAAIKAAADQEQLQIAFTTMLGSGEKAQKMLDDLARFSAETPFEMPQVQAAAKQLLAFGISADDIEPTLRQLGDVAAGVGAPIGDLAYLFGTASASGRLMTADINQFATRGIPIIDSLATVLGVSTSKIRDMAAEGLITSDHMKQAFAVMTADGSKFGGMMAAQSASLLGMWSTLKDNLTITLQQVGTELVKALDLNTIVSNALEKVGELRVKFVEFIQVNPELTKMGLLIAGVAAAVGPLLVGLGFIVTQVSALGPVIAALTGPIGLVVLGVAALATAFATDFMGIRTATMPVINEIIAGAQNMALGFGNIPQKLSEIVAGVATLEPVKTTIQTITTAFARFTASIGENFGSGSSFNAEMFAKLETVFANLKATLTTLQPALMMVGAILGGVVILALNTFASALANVADVAMPILDQIVSTLELVSGTLSGVATVAVGVSTGDWTLAWSGMQTVFTSFYTYFSTTAENIKSVMAAIVTFASESLTSTLEAFGIDTTGVVTATESLVGFIKGFTWPEWPGAPEFITALLAWVWPELPALVSSLLKWAWPQLPSVVKDLIDWEWPGMPEWVDNLFNWSWPTLPSLPSWLGGTAQALGTGFLQRGGPTLVGESGPEMVLLPRGVEVVNNRDLQRMGNQGGGITIGAINITTASSNPVQLANEVIQEINRRSRR
jgi:tape measure domain-containing protein